MSPGSTLVVASKQRTSRLAAHELNRSYGRRMLTGVELAIQSPLRRICVFAPQQATLLSVRSAQLNPIPAKTRVPTLTSRTPSSCCTDYRHFAVRRRSVAERAMICACDSSKIVPAKSSH